MNASAEIKLPPHSVEAEQSLIGGLLLDGRAWDRVADVVRETDFYRDDHRRIFRHITLLSNAGKLPDVVTVFESIERSNEVDQTGGLTYLAEVANSTVSIANIRRHAEIIREKATLRRLVGVGNDLQTQCFKPGLKTSTDIVAEIELKLAAEIDQQGDEPALIGDVVNDVLSYIDARDETSGLRTGFAEFDHLTGGLEGGQLVIVAARPSVGKTLFACNVADNVASRGKSVLFFTLEMTKREIGMRVLSARSSVSMHAMRSGTKDVAEWEHMSDAVPNIASNKLWVDDKPAITVSYVRACAKRTKRKSGLDLIVIDYLGLMTGYGDNRTQQIGSLSRDLKALAKELNVPIIVLAQLNRGVEGRNDKRPMMSDLRDSGEIEQDADIVAMLHREELYSESQDWKKFTELLLRKNRNGPVGEINLRYDGRLMTFSSWQGPSPRNSFKPKATGFPG
ncbi:MAG: replicative DNA helicase [Rugosibacter sp.]|nr:MAG: replicative DNA helicase [Rugosibacter sp.]TBR09927.1 MAG: replicative DNA helicase [Rugosibacter sp.]